MKTRFVLYLPSAAICIIFLLATSGCINDHVVFTTSTKFALDISQQADQPPKILLGYKREEGVFLPAPHKSGTENSEPEKNGTTAAAQQTTRTDTYSVVSFICVMANPSLWDAIKGLSPFSKNVPDGLQIHSFFATGVAAQHASEKKEVREFYQKAATQTTERAEKRCF